jgi:hypothetical protein
LNIHKSFPKEAKGDVLNSKEVVDMNGWKRRKGKASLHAIMQCSNKSYPLVRGGKDYLILPSLMHIGF